MRLHLTLERALSLTLELRQRRNEMRAAADKILLTAGESNRDLTQSELREHTTATAELRELDDRIDALRDEELREVRAAAVAAQTASAPVEHRGGVALAAELRALTGSGSTNGGAFTPTQFPDYFFDRLAADSVVLRSGVRRITTDRDTLVVPRWTADSTTAWTSEAGTISSTDATADQITATPRKLAGLQRISNEALNDSNPSLMDVVSAGLVRSIALTADLGFLEGSGTPPSIRGLKNVAGIGAGTFGTNGATPTTLDEIGTALGTLLTANATSTPAIVMHPRTWGTYIKIKEVAGSTKPTLMESAGGGTQGVTRSIYGCPVYLSSQLSIAETQGSSVDASSIYVYIPDQVVVVSRTDVRVEVDSSRLFNSDESEIRAITRLDMVVPNPAAVVRVVGARP